MKILVTGSAGFIGSSVSIKLLERGDEVVGIDNHNDYYDPQLKELRLSRHIHHSNYSHFRGDIENREFIKKIFSSERFDCVVNLAAQAGVRYSIENPNAYIDTNLVGFGNILEGCRQTEVQNLVYASSSSTYGLNTKQPFSVHHPVNHPVSLYAATKKANELMAHTYSHLYQIPTTGLRFFTVYGPYDRPDMALQKFANSIMKEETIKVYNYGNHKRDFTYIDDIVNGVVKVIDKPAASNSYWDSSNPDPSSSSAPYRIYNIGNNNPVNLMDYIKELEINLGKEAKKEFLPMQPGDVPDTYADISDLSDELGYQPFTSVSEGVKNFSEWFKEYYQSKI